MEKLVSSWFHNRSLPENYVFPPEKRPGKLIFPVGKTIPVVDLGGPDQTETVQQILKASEEFGFFQVINHGVSKNLMDDTMSIIKEFHAMPAEDKVRECSKDPKGSCRLYTSSENYTNEEVHYWRDALTHPCHPLEEYMQFWPENPSRYREVIGTYAVEGRKLGSRILELICEGLNLSTGYFNSGLSENPTMLINHYPPCPDPSLTLGLSKHRDPSILTIVLQGDVHGLQVFKDEEWIGIESLPHAFVVNIGYLLQIISNGKLKGAEHRVVTNSSIARTTASLFIYPSDDCLVEPAKALINACNPPLYRAFKNKDFRINFLSKKGDAEAVQDFIRHTTN